ncbi:MAG TPA: hypothetical protein VLH19_03895 [Patescibacteria group bacterium]|nr:hypothetical protein [Patescibacteria group bacterium]
MSYTIEHRKDNLLQGTATEEVDPNLKGTYIEAVTIPAHIATLNFINEHLIGREFETVEELEDVLKQWPDYAHTHGLNPDGNGDFSIRDWEEIRVMGKRGGKEQEYKLIEPTHLAFDSNSPGGPFRVANIVRL